MPEEIMDDLEGRIIYDSGKTRVELISADGQQYVRKTVKPIFCSESLARWLCRRETKVLERVQGVEGVQQLVKQDSPVSFISRYEEGIPLRWAEHIPEDYFEKLGAVLSNIHARGVADIDFAHSTDLLVTKTGDPFVIDLAASVIYEASSGFSAFVKPGFDYICDLNRRYIVRRKGRFLPGSLTQEEQEYSKIGFFLESQRKLRESGMYSTIQSYVSGR